MFEFKMPSMGADMQNGTLVQWNYAVGDHVDKGDIICEIETAKGNIDVEIWESGTIVELLVEPGTKVPVGEVMAHLDTGATAAPAPEETPAPEPVPRAETPTVEEPPHPMAQATTGRVSASPAARRRAAEVGVSLDEIVGSGPGGTIKLEDVERPVASEHHRATPVARKMADDEGLDVDELTGTGPHDRVTRADVEREAAARGRAPKAAYGALRGAIARAMAKSKREIPHYHLKSTFDVSDAVTWLTGQNASRTLDKRLVFGALTARAVALAARDVPEMNGFFDGAFRPSEAVHLGFAISMRGGGVVAPAIHDVPAQSLDDTMGAIKDLVNRVRGGKLRSSEMTDATITLTSLGEEAADMVFGVIYPPQVAIVGVGSPRQIPFARDGMVGVHICVDVTLSGDHRVSDGIAGARFLRRIQHYLQSPDQL